MAQRITQKMLDYKQSEYLQLLNEVTGITGMTLYHGSKEMGITNKLVINKTNVWADGMAGHTTREAYNALRLMISTLAVVADSRRST